MESDLNWPLNSIVYHIYVRSFKDSNNDGIGDLRGLIEKIDYLKELGVNALWLSPIYPSPQIDFGYDIANYIDIDPVYGTLKDFDELLHTAHKHTIKIMMDYVPNHTSDQHEWFLQSRSSINNPKRDWYLWANPQSDGSPPNNWMSHFGGSGWEMDKTTGQYYFHSFDVHQPDLNWRNPEVVKTMLNVLRFWMDRGVDGFRVDVANHMFKDHLLRNEPNNPNFTEGTHGQYDMHIHTFTRDLPEYIDMLKKFVDVLKEYKNKCMVTEAWVSLPDLIKLYMTIGWKWYAPFNFSFMTLPWTAEIHKQYIDEYDKTLGDLYIPCWVLGNHDKSRVASRIGHAQARIAAMAQLTLRGLPFIYYGEEIGMNDGEIPPEKVQDTYEKRSPGLKLGRDPQRTPMQWDNSLYAGFSSHVPWLPVSSNYKEYSVSIQQEDKNSFLSLYKKLIHLRKKNRALLAGNYTPLPCPAKNVFAYLREKDNKKILVVLNFDSEEKKMSLDFTNAKVLCNASLTAIEGPMDLSDFTLQSNEGYIFSLS